MRKKQYEIQCIIDQKVKKQGFRLKIEIYLLQ